MSSSSSSAATNLPTPTPTPTADERDDLIYFSRSGDLDELKSLVAQLCATHAVTPSVILAAAIDVDEDGLGSQSSLLHYPAANGNLEIVNYLISLLTPSTAPQLVNHKNVSGNTPLHWAGMNGHLEVVKVLVQAGADPGIVNAAGRDAVVESECSAKEGAEACADWMLKNCDGLEKGFGNADADAGEEVGVAVAATDDDMDVDAEGTTEVATEAEEGSGNGPATSNSTSIQEP